MPPRIPHKFIDGVEYKRCSSCKEYEILTTFTKSKERWDGLSAKCMTCKKAVYKKYYQENKEKLAQYNKIYYKKNREKHNATHNKWRKANPEKTRNNRKRCNRKRTLNGKSRIYKKNRYHNDSKFRLLGNLRTRLQGALRAQGVRKTTSTMKLCGCSLEKLKQHIEDQFYDGMSWEKKNFHIDHMEPCALFNLEDQEEQRKCFHYTNLKPEWPFKNMSDGGRRKWNMEWNGKRWIVHGKLSINT